MGNMGEIHQNTGEIMGNMGEVGGLQKKKMC